MAASSALLRMLLVLCALAAPALAVVCTPRGPVKTCTGVKCCNGLKCSFTSTGGGFYCL
jgi:hypothetical protein